MQSENQNHSVSAAHRGSNPTGKTAGRNRCTPSASVKSGTETPRPPRETTGAPEKRSGRPPRSRGNLTVHRERTEITQGSNGDESIIRVRTNADRVMLALILILLSLGSIMVFSASYPSALAERGDSLHYIKKQLLFIVIGVAGMFAASMFPPSFYKKVAIPAYGVSIILLILVLVIGINDG